MLGDPMVLHFNENVEVTPMRVSTCSQVAVHLQKGYDRAVENMHRSGIIEPVPSDEPPSHWCFRGMVVMKPSGDPEDPRIVVDCSRLNPGLLRPIQVGHQVKFAGYLFCYGTVRPHPDRLKSIEEFPQPCDKSGIRSFCGLANQLSMFHPDMAHVLRPLNELLRKNVEF
eukprot:01754.XXX_3717_2851_1 [CDS] Oithona nana genome sequencing.